MKITSSSGFQNQVRTTHTKIHKHDSEIIILNHKPLSKEWINNRSRKHVAYNIVLSAVKLPKISQHLILLVGLIN